MKNRLLSMFSTIKRKCPLLWEEFQKSGAHGQTVAALGAGEELLELGDDHRGGHQLLDTLHVVVEANLTGVGLQRFELLLHDLGVPLALDVLSHEHGGEVTDPRHEHAALALVRHLVEEVDALLDHDLLALVAALDELGDVGVVGDDLVFVGHLEAAQILLGLDPGVHEAEDDLVVGRDGERGLGGHEHREIALGAAAQVRAEGAVGVEGGRIESVAHEAYSGVIAFEDLKILHVFCCVVNNFAYTKENPRGFWRWGSGT